MESVIEQNFAVRTQSVFKNRNFLLVFTGKIISMVGDNLYIFALGWFVLSVTHSSLQMGIVLTLGLLPAVILGPVAGIIADKYSRKNIMITMDILRFLIVIALAVLLKNNMLQIWLVYIGTVVLGICSAVFNPAASSIIPNIVKEEQLTQAISKDQFLWSFCSIFGMVAGGILYGLLGITMIFIINAFSFLISAVLEFLLKVPERDYAKSNNLDTGSKSKIKNIISDLSAGYKFLISNKDLFIVYIYFAFLNFLLYPVGCIYLPYIFNVILKGESIQSALVQSSFFIGVFIGSFIVPLFSGRLSFRSTLIKSSIIVFWVILFFSIPVSPAVLYHLNVWLVAAFYMILSAIMGISMTFVNIHVGVIFQRKVLDEVRGRVSALVSAIISAMMPVSFFIGGYLAQSVQMYILLIITTTIFGVSIIVVSRFRQLKEL